MSTTLDTAPNGSTESHNSGLRIFESLLVTFSFSGHWHVGTGQESEATDGLQANEKGNPVLPGTSIKGLAKDEARSMIDVFSSLDGNEISADELLRDVFGEKSGPKSKDGAWTFGSARRVKHQAGPDLGSCAVHHQNRIDPVTGRVPDDVFFDVEIVKGGVFTASVRRFEIPGLSHSLRGQALLVASLRSITGVGIRRSRGWGRCLTDVTAFNGDTLITSNILMAPLFDSPGATS
jgi:hypothetical protein